MSIKTLIRRHRLLALASVAVVAAPLALTPILSTGHAQAEDAAAPASTATVPVSGITAPGGSFAPIVAADKPAVVTVLTKIKAENASSDNSNGPNGPNGMPQFAPGSPMDEFFKQFFGQNGPMPMPQPRGQGESEALGSGFIINADGTIVTNNHVIDKAAEIKVVLDDGTEVPAKLVGRDAKTDLAVLKISTDKKLATVAWGDSDKLQLGDQVLAIGNPFGIGTTVTAGIVSARGRDLHSGPYDDFIQVDAAINHGNSGGPLVDMQGHVVGINSAIYSPNGGNVGVGFAIPSDQAKVIVAKLIQNGSIEHGFIGVQIQPVTEDVANALGLDKANGALIAGVGDGSPAEKAGVHTGDVVTAFNNTPVKDPKDLARAVADVAPGTKQTLTVWRKDKSVDLAITIGQNEDGQQMAMGNGNSDSGDAQSSKVTIPSLGLGLADITPDLRQSYQLSEDEHGALVESVSPDKAAADHGLQEGDVIVSVNQQDVTTASDARNAIEKAEKGGRKSVLLLVERGGDQTFVAIPLGKA